MQTCLELKFNSQPPLVCTAGKLDAELVAATRRVSGMLQKLPREITPVRAWAHGEGLQH